MEGTYFFGEHLRWNLGWENPNPAGAFVATFLPFLWAISQGLRKKKWSFGTALLFLFVLEFGVWFLLCKTYSRGALVAVGAAAGFFFLAVELRTFLQKEKFNSACFPNWLPWLVRGIGVFVILTATGFLDRIEPSYVSSDASATNRLTLWKGGVQMIACEPWSGWGVGQSGPQFMHWFQPVDEEYAYAGMVNSYLHVGVERGLPFLFLIFLGAGLILFLGFWNWLRFEDKFVSLINFGAFASMLVFLLSNVFSTLWIFPNLWWMPGFSTLVILFSSSWRFANSREDFRKEASRSLCLSSLASLIVCGVLFLLGIRFEHDLKVQQVDKSLIHIQESGGEDALGEAEIYVFPDEATFGESFGKEMRNWILDSEPDLQALNVVMEPLGEELETDKAIVIVASGVRVEEAFQAAQQENVKKLILIHPDGKPPEEEEFSSLDVFVYLPMLDITGQKRRWLKACKKNERWSSQQNPGVGQDIRLIWPLELPLS